MAAPHSLLLLAGLSCLFLQGGVAQVSNVVTAWNVALGKSLLTYGLRHQIGLRYFSLLHLAQTRTLVANRNRSTPFNETLVAAVSSHHILSVLLPDQQITSYDLLIAQQLANFAYSDYLGARSFVKPIITSSIVRRVDDVSQLWYNYSAFPAGTDGKYQLAPGQTYFVYPQLGNTTTFWANKTLFTSKYQPYDINDPKFLADLQEVYNIGSGASPNANNYTKDTADFWADGAGTSYHGGHWNLIALQLLPSYFSLLDTARALATLNTLAYDANIVTWYLKYTISYWRPITAIRTVHLELL